MRILRRQSLLAFGLSLFCTFTAASPLDFDTKSHLAVPGDFNGDGRMDVLMQPLVGDGKGAIILQDGTGQLSVLAQGWDTGYLGLDWSTKESTLTTADLNGDGQDDVLMQPVKAGGTATVLITDPTVQLLQISQLLPSGYLNLDWSSETHHAVAGDFDGDRHKELFMQATGPGGLGAIAHADQMGNIVAITQTFVDGYLGRHWNSKDETLYVGDFNGDGRQDLLVQSHGAIAGESAYALLLADGNGQFTRIAQTWNLKDLGANWNPATHKVIIEDANHDGIMDIVLQSTVKGGTNYVFEGNGQGLFMQPAAHWTGDKSAADALAATTSSTKTSNTGVKLHSTGGMIANTISGPTDPETDPVIVRSPQTGGLGQGQALGSGAIMSVNAAGALQGSGGVSGGTATYSIPISVPPGIAGMQPSISLNYSSRGGNGEMGMGWSVSAGSQIHRCPATTAMDGYASGVTYASTDRLCLDGQHLILMSGNYGASGAVYRTELDSFAQITESGAISSGNSSFSVIEKDGHSLHYGYATGYTPNAVFTPSGAPAPLAWGLSMEVDTYNNSIIYYYSTFGAGEYLLTSIKYTGSGATAGNREVDFSYSARSDVTTQYLAGGLTTQSQILNNVSIFENGSQVRLYTVEYAASGATNRSLLTGVQECGFASGAESCLPETNFSWENPSPHFADPSSVDLNDPCATNVAMPNQPYMFSPGDMNGDGFKDLIFNTGCNKVFLYLMGPGGAPLGSPIDISKVFTLQAYYVADIDGDGAADLISEMNSGGDLGYASYGATSQSFSKPIDLGIPYSQVVDIKDVDGDGLPDVVVIVPDPSNSNNHMLAVYLNTTRPCTAAPCHPTVTFRNTPIKMLSEPDSSSNPMYAIPAGDMDGNGLPDYAATYMDSGGTSHTLFVFTMEDSSGNLSFTSLDRAASGLTLGGQGGMSLDINGDGLPDRVYDCTTSKVWCYQLNTGKIGSAMFGPEQNTGYSDSRGANQVSGTFEADYDNDGMQEIIIPGAMLSEYCLDGQKQLIDGTWEPVTKCAQSGTYTLPPGEDFSVYQYYALKFYPQSNGSGGYTYVPTLIRTSVKGQSHLAAAIDLAGDGLTGVVSPFTKWYIGGHLNDLGGYSHPSGPSVALNSSGSTYSEDAAPDLMLTATDGFGRSAQWDYFPLSSAKQFNSMPLYYSPGVAGNGYASGDYFYFASSMYVVGDYAVSNGVGGLNTHEFHYGQAIYNNQGRGFQGFRIVVDDDMTNIPLGASSRPRTVQVYHQRFPLSGELVESWTTSQVDAVDLTTQNPARGPNAIDDVTYQWGCIQGSQPGMTVDGIRCGGVTMDANTYVPVLLNSTESHYDVVSHDQLSQTSTQYCAVASGACAGFGYDLYANSLGSVTTTTDTYGADADSRTGVLSQQGTYTASVSNGYAAPDLTNWWVNKLSSKTTTTTAEYGVAPATSVTRTTNYDYYTTRGLNHVSAMEDGQAANESITQYQYSGGNITSAAVTGGTGLGAISRTTTTTYSTGADAGYFVQTVTDPMGLITTYQMDQRFGLPASVTAPDGAQTVNTYDAFGRKITSQLGSLPVQTTSYIPADSTCAGTSATSQYYVLVNQTGYPSHYACYDMLNRVLRTVHENLSDQSDLVAQSTYYDNHGRVTQFTDPHFSSASWIWNTNQYDDSNILGRLSGKTDAKGITTTYAYNDLVTEVVTTPPDSSPRQDEEVKNSLGKLMTVTNAVGAAEQAATSYQYDSDGNPVTITAADNTQINAVFDVLGHKTSVTDPDQGTTQYSYDVAGDLISQTDAKGQTLAMTYDDDGRMLTKGSSGTAVLEPAVAWTYDNCTHGAGKLCTVAVADKSYSEAYTYTALGMVKSDIETIGGTPTTAGTPYETDTAYDSDGRIALVTYPYTSVTDQPPVANAGSTQYVLPGSTVTLSGSATDPDNGPDPLGYQWSQTAGPAISLSSTSVAGPSFSAGTTLGTTYTFQLTADDGLLTSTASVNVVVPNAPTAPATPTDDGDTNHDGVYTVSWSGVSVPGTNILYHLEEATGTASAATGTWKECYVGSTPSVSIDHSGNSYYYYWYRVRAEDQISGTSIGYSGYSGNDSIHVVVKPGSPASISPGTGTTTTGTYNISWGPATGGIVTADIYYQLFVSSSSNFSSTSMVYTGVARSQSFTNAIGDYYYEVRACNTSATVTECSGYTLKAHEIVEATTPPPGGPGGPTQPQIVVQIKPVPPPSTSVGPTGSLVPVSPILLQLQEVRRTETLDGSAHEAKGREGQLVAEVQGRVNTAEGKEPRAATASSNVSGYVRPKFALPVYKAWADAKAQNATATAQVVRFSVQYVYSPNGYLSQLADGVNPNRVYWWVDSNAPTVNNSNETVDEHGMNAYGQVTDVLFGSGAQAGLDTHYAYDGTTDYLDSIDTINVNKVNNTTTTYQDLTYNWHTNGDLQSRSSGTTVTNANTLSESFTYDLHNRLTSSQVTNGNGVQTPVTFAYDSVGDITCRSDVTGHDCSIIPTGYGYGPTANSPIAGPHALTSTTGGTVNGSYSYDPNGNMTCRSYTGACSPSGQNITWNSDNLAIKITQGGYTSSFSYAPDKHRYMQVATMAGGTETTIYAGGLEQITDVTGATQYRVTLSAYGRPVFLDTLSSNAGSPQEKQHYLLTDHLGSVDTVVDSSLTVQPQESFDTFGKRRDSTTWAGSPTAAAVTAARAVTHRGFTHHEHLDNLTVTDSNHNTIDGIVHMNGRVYDPTVGRFLSVDPVFQAPTNSQSVNPYSYVMNNPLSLVDPSGYESTCTTTDPSTGGSTSCSNVSTSDVKDGQTIHAKVDTTAIGSHITTHANYDITVSKADANPGDKASIEGATQHVLGTLANGAITGNRANEAQHQPGSAAEVGDAKTTGSAGSSTNGTLQHLQLDQIHGMTDEEQQYTELLDSRIGAYGDKLVENFATNVMANDAQGTSMALEALGAYSDTRYIYSGAEDNNNLAKGGFFPNETTKTMDRRVIFYRSSQDLMYEGQAAPPGYTMRIRQGAPGLDDLIAHESGHTMYSLMFQSFTNWGNYQQFGKTQMEHNADNWALYMRNY